MAYNGLGIERVMSIVSAQRFAKRLSIVFVHQAVDPSQCLNSGSSSWKAIEQRRKYCVCEISLVSKIPTGQ